MKKVIASVLALLIAFVAILGITRIDVGNVGVVYSAKGVEDETLAPGWHWTGLIKRVKEFPVSQQQIVFSNNPSDYNKKEHDDWSIDAPANGGMVKINLTVNYSFNPDGVVSLFKRFNGMSGEDIVESRVQNSIIAYVKEVTPQFSVMDIYSNKRLAANKEITKYLNERLTEEYGINVLNALIIDAQLDDSLQTKIRAKEQAKQDAEIAELAKQTAEAQAETNKTIAQAQAEVDVIKAKAAAEVTVVEAEAQAEANRALAQSITPELIQMTEAEARLKHGWVTVTGAGTVVAKP